MLLLCLLAGARVVGEEAKVEAACACLALVLSARPVLEKRGRRGRSE
jgi:hypothetical protein